MSDLSLWRRVEQARRVVITGANGAGKTTLALRICDQIRAGGGVPDLIHADALKLTTQWQTRPQDEARAALLRRLQGAAWVLEGGPSCLIPQALDAADLILWLRPPARLRLGRILRRSWQMRGQTRAELPPGNPESFDTRALRFAWRSWRREALFTQQIADALRGYEVVTLRGSGRATTG